jgi:hypothetical protein
VKSLDKKKAKNKRLFGLLLLLACSVTLTVAVGLALSSPDNNQEPDILSTDSISTSDDANKIAIPIIEQYAEENNRTITTVDATLRDSTHRSYWFILADFEATEGKGYHERSCAYQVSVWKDTGEIWHQGPIWQNAWRNVSASDNPIKIPMDEAIATALPVSEQYAKENNRTLTSMIETSLSNYADSRPSWHINIKFEPVKNGEQYWKDAQYWIDAYQVSIWADTGEIQSHNERGWY